MILTEQQRATAVNLYKSVQDRLGQAFETIDGAATFERKSWNRDGEQGGGTMGVLRGKVVEKAGANVSAVQGANYPAIEGDHKGKPFFAAGVSTITHMMNPHAPIAHMNVRILDVGDKFWIGGGADLTPFIPYEEDTRQFHDAMREACAIIGPNAYAEYSKWCDEYFYIPHRQSIRGVGGIFFDYLTVDFDKAMAFQKAVTDGYLSAYPAILERRAKLPYTDEQKDGQLYWRGRYAEFNLVYDRGTKFGLMTGGNIEAIFVSLPPVVKW